MPEPKLNVAALGPLYRAAIDVITEWEATPQDHGLDEALDSLRAAIALAESPAEQPCVKSDCAGTSVTGTMSAHCKHGVSLNNRCYECKWESAPAEQPSSYVLVDEIRKALRNGGPLADAVRRVIREEESLEHPAFGEMTMERARGIASRLRCTYQKSVANSLWYADRAARQETLEWVLQQARDGWVLAGVVEHRLKELK